MTTRYILYHFLGSVYCFLSAVSHEREREHIASVLLWTNSAWYVHNLYGGL